MLYCPELICLRLKVENDGKETRSLIFAAFCLYAVNMSGGMCMMNGRKLVNCPDNIVLICKIYTDYLWDSDERLNI